MNDPEINTQNRTLAVYSLAVVGFVALIGASLWFAVYSTRFVPGVVSRIGGAAVYLGSVFTPAPEPSLSVVTTPTASTTIPFGEASSTISTSANSTTTKLATPTGAKSTPTTAGEKTSTTQQISGTSASPTLFGLPDFVVTINAIGYLGAASADSLIASSTVPSGFRPAVSFTIKNIGTNATGSWRFSASIPTQAAYIYQSQLQQSLAPGDSIEYTLGFDQAIPGTDKMISITANFDRTVTESNMDNDSASAKVTIIGG